jgi:hypothetical protein
MNPIFHLNFLHTSVTLILLYPFITQKSCAKPWLLIFLLFSHELGETLTGKSSFVEYECQSPVFWCIKAAKGLCSFFKKKLIRILVSFRVSFIFIFLTLFCLLLSFFLLLLLLLFIYLFIYFFNFRKKKSFNIEYESLNWSLAPGYTRKHNFCVLGPKSLQMIL